MFPDLRTGADLRCLRARIDRSAARQGTWLRNPLTVGVQVAKGTRSPFIPANSWLGRSHRGMLNVSLLGFHLFFSFELPYLKASKKANLATDLNVTNQSEQNHLMSASS